MSAIMIGKQVKDKRSFTVFEGNKQEQFTASRSELVSIRNTIDVMINHFGDNG